MSESDLLQIQILIRKNIITPKQLQECQQLQLGLQKDGKTISTIEVLLQKQYITQEKLATALGKPFGRYYLVKELGRGAMGIVYAAYDTKLRRNVALKTISQAITGENEVEVLRFVREANLMAKLNHPNIVKIFDIGKEQDHHFFTMELIEGSSLDKLMAGNMPLPQLLAILMQVARAVHCAHQQGIIHRDLKPANIMVTSQNEAKVMDFGLAKQTDKTAQKLSQSLDIIGTPHYMAPEQAARRIKDVDARTDVYALGVILYEMLTGRIPFRADTMDNLFYQIIFVEPSPPSRFYHSVSRDIEAVCLKAMEKDKSQRYQNASQFAEDISRYLEGNPVTAKPLTVWRRIQKWIYRHRLVSIMSTGTALMVLALSVWFVYQQRQLAQKETRLKEAAEKKWQAAEQNWQVAEQQKTAALLREIHAMLNLAEVDLVLAKTSLDQRNYFAAHEGQKKAAGLLRQVCPNIQQNQWSQEKKSELTAQYQALQKASLDMSCYVIDYFMPRRDIIQLPRQALGPTQASCTWAALVDEPSKATVVWDIQRQKEIKRFNIVAKDYAVVAFSAGNQWVALAENNKLVLWDSGKDRVYEQQLPLGNDDFTPCLKFSPGPKWLLAYSGASGSEANTTMLIALSNPLSPVLLTLDQQQHVSAEAFSSNGESLALAMHQNTIFFFDLRQQGEKLTTPLGTNKIVSAERLCFGPQDASLISAYCNDILVDPLSKFEDKSTIVAAHQGRFTALALSQDNRFLFSAGHDGRLVCWNTFNYAKAWESADGQLNNLANIATYPEDEQMMVWTRDMAIRYTWDIKTAKRMHTIKRTETHNKQAWQAFQHLQRNHFVRNLGFKLANISFSHDSQYLVCYTCPNIWLWHWPSDAIRHLSIYTCFSETNYSDRHLAFDEKDENVLFASAHPGLARIFQTRTGQPGVTIDAKTGQLFWFATNNTIVSLTENTVETWQIVGDRLRRQNSFNMPYRPRSTGAVSLDQAGRRLVRAQYGCGDVDVWDIPTGQKTASIRLDGNNYRVVSFLEDSRLALGSDNGELTICHLQPSQGQKQSNVVCSFLSPIRAIWHQVAARLYWVYTSNGLYIYPDTEDESQRQSINQIYPLQLFSGYPVLACTISYDFRYLAVLMQSGELLVVPLPEVKE